MSGSGSRVNSRDNKNMLMGHGTAKGHTPFSGLPTGWGTDVGEMFSRGVCRCNEIGLTAQSSVMKLRPHG